MGNSSSLLPEAVKLKNLKFLYIPTYSKIWRSGFSIRKVRKSFTHSPHSFSLFNQRYFSITLLGFRTYLGGFLTFLSPIMALGRVGRTIKVA
jgi:hypothetical protein